MLATSESGTNSNAQDENHSPNQMPLDCGCPGPWSSPFRSKQGPQIPVSQNSLPQISTLPNRSENHHPGPELHSGYRCCSTTFSHLHYSFHVYHIRSSDAVSYRQRGPSRYFSYLCVATSHHPVLAPHRVHCCIMLWLRALVTASWLWSAPHSNALGVNSAQNDGTCQCVALDYVDSGSYLIDATSEGKFSYASMFEGM